MPGHNPRSRQDRYRRVQYYVSVLGASASAQLKQALLVLRNAADQLPSPELSRAARKQYLESEFLPATKEMLCIWLHLEAIDQGGEMMPQWLMNYLKLALYATDFLIDSPTAVSIMEQHAQCMDMQTLIAHVCESLGRRLGYGDVSSQLAPAFAPLLENSRAVRQKALRESLTMDTGTY
jgi:hypothetical protein